MITKMKLNPLSGFKTIDPSTNVKHNYILSISKKSIHLNKAIFKHFHGWRYFKFAVKGHEVAIEKSGMNARGIVKVPVRDSSDHGHNYDSLTNRNLRSQLLKLTPNGQTSQRMRFIAVPKNVYDNCMIFDLSKPVIDKRI